MLASDSEAVVFSWFEVYGCLKALGDTRVLINPSDPRYRVLSVRLAGRFAAIEAAPYPAPITTETLVDLGSGKVTRLATTLPDPFDRLDSFMLNSSGFATWRQTVSPIPQSIAGISCPSASLCVAGDATGNILSSTNPSGGASAWNSAGGSSIGGVSCPSVSLCVAVGGNHVLTATDPSGGASAWTKTTVDKGGFGSNPAVSCPAVSLCVAGDQNGNILTSTDPTGGASAWTKTKLATGTYNGLNAVSCPSVSLCVAGASDGNIFTSTDPTGGVSAWTKAKIDHVRAVSCPSVSLCVAVDDAGRALTSTDPTGGASTWTKASIDPKTILTGVSCPSVSLCVAVDDDGNIVSSTDPTGGASAWTRTLVDRGVLYGLSAVSCASVSLCVAGDLSGNILSSTDPTGGANTWTRAAVDLPRCAPQLSPCISEQLYAHDDQGTRVVDTAPPGQGNSIGNVALASHVLSWTHDGAQRQLLLR